MQIIWMVMVTLVLALSGVLALALAAHVADRAKRRSPRASPPTAQPLELRLCVAGDPQTAATGGGCQAVAASTQRVVVP